MVTPARPRALVDALLAAVMVLQCVGALGIAVRQGHVVEQVGTALALGAALLVALRGERRAAWVVAGWFFAEALYETLTGSEPTAMLDLGCHAARYGVPLAVALPRSAVPILRAAASLTFIGHGIEALCLKPIFVAYIQVAGSHVGLAISHPVAAGLLRAIGTVDVVVGIALSLRGPRPWVAGYMSAWGIITALARVVYAGPAGLVDCLLRAANGGAPLALWLGWRGGAAARPAREARP